MVRQSAVNRPTGGSIPSAGATELASQRELYASKAHLAERLSRTQEVPVRFRMEALWPARLAVRMPGLSIRGEGFESPAGREM